jgi:hypothetical protein
MIVGWVGVFWRKLEDGRWLPGFKYVSRVDFEITTAKDLEIQVRSQVEEFAKRGLYMHDSEILYLKDK